MVLAERKHIYKSYQNVTDDTHLRFFQCIGFRELLMERTRGLGIPKVGNFDIVEEHPGRVYLGHWQEMRACRGQKPLGVPEYIKTREKEWKHFKKWRENKDPKKRGQRWKRMCDLGNFECSGVSTCVVGDKWQRKPIISETESEVIGTLRAQPNVVKPPINSNSLLMVGCQWLGPKVAYKRVAKDLERVTKVAYKWLSSRGVQIITYKWGLLVMGEGSFRIGGFN